MQPLSRRTFIKSSACATMGFPFLGKGWLTLTAAEVPGHFEREFGITDAVCRRILAEALSKGGDFSELFFEHTISNSLTLEDGKVNRASSQADLGVGIRTVAGEQVGYAFTQELTERSMLNAAATAATIASSGAVAPEGEFRQIALEDAYPLDRPYTAVPLEEKLPLVQAVNDLAFARSPLVVKVTVQYQDQQRRIMVVTSDGVKVEDLQPRTHIWAMTVGEKDGQRQQASWGQGGRESLSFYTSTVLEEVAHGAVDRALVLFDAVQPPAGQMPVVFGPGVTGVLLHEAIGHGLEADFNRRGESTYATMIGRKVAEPFVTIIDNGTNPGMLGSINVDDEGTPGQKTVLVEEGILIGYLHDRISARHYGVSPTGNGRRQSYQHFPLPRMRNTYMLAGQAAPEDLIREAGRGLYVEDVSSGQVKIGEGDFAFYVSQGRLMEDGKLTAPIRDVNIMGNGPRMLADITMMGHDLEMARGGPGACGKGGQSVPVGLGQPSALVRSLTVGGVTRPAS